jgi:hypothetical protein
VVCLALLFLHRRSGGRGLDELRIMYFIDKEVG